MTRNIPSKAERMCKSPVVVAVGGESEQFEGTTQVGKTERRPVGLEGRQRGRVWLKTRLKTQPYQVGPCKPIELTAEGWIPIP